MAILGLPVNIGFGKSKTLGTEVPPPPQVAVELPIEINDLKNGDILLYKAADSVWKNTPSEELVDGGNF